MAQQKVARTVMGRAAVSRAMVIQQVAARVTAGRVTAGLAAMASGIRAVRHLSRTGSGAAPMSPGTGTPIAKRTLTWAGRTAAQLPRTRTTAPPVQRTGWAKIHRPGLPYRCRPRPLLPAAPARLARARPAHKIGAALPRARPWPV